ncbi:LLM class flavin-dependent oxidoreductase [Actinoallomurus soli]|uniref:LLM class flavin-dependent oxidoreductase n=1 Tax=Actinoallomurus soli TaxID=2952535 RepID=UPI00209386FD|nr:LLM class flavin-dependent oxidoreductase [Actinoallomurus soli]MCO5974072.1 LLM class flavin-dependent oxidoreductase [Actinoallomurus soli]
MAINDSGHGAPTAEEDRGKAHGGVRISVLDTSPIVSGSTARQALLATVDLAVAADALGYHRYWVPEHHSMRGVACSAPAVLVGHLANATRRIRVGAGGVLLPNHAPIVVAEQFGTLAALHPGRIDLGIGRALGGPRRAADAVRSETERTAKSFRRQITELLGYFDGASDDGVRAIPAIGNRPAIWILGSSAASARLAASLGLAYAFAHHLNPGEAVNAVRAHRALRRPPETAGPAPPALISVSVIAADTDERAEWLAGPLRLKLLSRAQGRRILLPRPEEAAAHPYTDADRVEIAERTKGVVVGSPETVRRRLQRLLDETGADELMVTTPVYDHADRRRSYELLGGIAPSLRSACGSPHVAEVDREV